MTACGECCDGCNKRAMGQCRGCMETEGRCEEWAESGVCPVYACARAHQAAFCGVCPAFPCDQLPMMKWRPDCVAELQQLAVLYRQQKVEESGSI